MANIALSLLSICSLAAAIPNPLGGAEPVAPAPAPSCSLDVNNPSACDPTAAPKTISFPTDKPDNPYPSGIPIQPDTCDGQNPSQDCFNAMGSGE